MPGDARVAGLSAPDLATTARGVFAFRQAGNDAGTAVVLLHGWPESSYAWQRVAALLDGGFLVIAPDLRGHGDSTREGDKSNWEKRALAEDVLSVLDALRVETFLLVGHDWGGLVAQELTLLAPHRVARLVLMNAPVINNVHGNRGATTSIRAGGSRHYWYQHFQQQRDLPEQLLPGKEEPWLRHFLRDSKGKHLDDDIIAEHTRWYSIPGTSGACANLYRTMREDQARWDTLDSHIWKVPALYLYGEHDPVIVPAYLDHIERCFDNLRVERVNAGHFLHEEAPTEVARHLNSFLGKGNTR